MNLSSGKLLKNNFFNSCIISFFTFFLYLPSIKIPFINDEISFIQRNAVTSFLGFINLFDKKEYDGYYYRPLGDFISGITTSIFHYNFEYYRLFNISLLICTGIIVYFLLLNILSGKENNKIIALFGSLLFIAFPINDYVIFWQTDLFDRLMIIFYLSGILIFIRKNCKVDIYSLILFFLALLSKEMAFSFPLTIILISYYFSNTPHKLKESIKRSLPYLIVMAFFILFRIICFSNNVFEAKDAHSVHTIFDAIKNYFLFFGLLAFPFFIREVQNIVIHYKLLSLASIVILFFPLVYFLSKKAKKEPILIFFLLFIIITLAPASRLFMRWYLYLPEVGFTGFVSYFIFSLNFNKKIIPIIIAVSLLIIYSSTLLFKENDWILDSNKAISSLKTFLSANKSEIEKSNEANFLTIPAKVDDIPVFNLGFSQLLNYYGNFAKTVNVNVYSKSFIYNFEDSLFIKIKDKNIMLNQVKDNYFILFNDGKNINFETNNKIKISRKSLVVKDQELMNKILYTFSNGRFIKIKE